MGNVVFLIVLKSSICFHLSKVTFISLTNENRSAVNLLTDYCLFLIGFCLLGKHFWEAHTAADDMLDKVCNC